MNHTTSTARSLLLRSVCISSGSRLGRSAIDGCPQILARSPKSWRAGILVRKRIIGSAVPERFQALAGMATPGYSETCFELPIHRSKCRNLDLFAGG